MKESDVYVKNLESNIKESNLPTEFLEKAQKLIEKRIDDENELRQNLTPFKGRDDRLSPQIKKLDIKFRADIAKLRKEYHLD